MRLYKSRRCRRIKMIEGAKIALKESCPSLARANENMLTEMRYCYTFKCCQLLLDNQFEIYTGIYINMGLL